MAKNKPPRAGSTRGPRNEDRDEPAPDSSTGSASAEPIDDFTEPVKLPAWFKQALERLTLEMNQQRKRKDPKNKKLPLGWLVVNQMGEWLKEELQTLDQKRRDSE